MMAESVVRKSMSEYWSEHAVQGTSVKEMMLDNEAEHFTEKERLEIVNLLPEIKDKCVLELGAGIGRFTSEIAKSAKSVIAVDFMQRFVDENRKTNGHLQNVSFLCADVMKLKIPEKSIDVLFSNWLFMYLSDEEILKLVPEMLSWLKDDGYFFYRESCFYRSGSVARNLNPTRYRSPNLYNSLMLRPNIYDSHLNAFYGFKMINCTPVQTYIQVKNNSNQIVWLLQKSSIEPAQKGFKLVQLLLDKHRHSSKTLERYQAIHGNKFVSFGGLHITQELTLNLGLKIGDKVLDIGCCPGGTADYLTKQYGVEYVGLHHSSSLIDMAEHGTNGYQDLKVQYELCNEATFKANHGSFDAIYCRDHFIHFSDKIGMLKNIYNWLKPGGRLVLTDITRDHDTPSFAEYTSQGGYHLVTSDSYKKAIESVGFEQFTVEDRTEQFIGILQQELTAFCNHADALKKRFGDTACDLVSDGWESVIDLCDKGILEWTVITAKKPL